jgi:SAM-dependent methyltransferase
MPCAPRRRRLRPSPIAHRLSPTRPWIYTHSVQWDAVDEFHSPHYLRHNQRRQEHLASLGLPLAGRSVIEVGAGIGDHTSFFLDRGCQVLTTEGRPEHLRVLRERFPQLDARLLDLDNPDPEFATQAEIVYCYGTLYHLERPAEALAFLGRLALELLLLETCVSPDNEERVNPVREEIRNPSQALGGRGCRPTRPWLWAQLSKLFPYVYATTTQPWHEEFPLEWSFEAQPDRLTRAVFVASRRPLDSPSLATWLPNTQRRH